MKQLRQTVATNGAAANPLDGASVLRKYIMKVRNSFQNFDPDPDPEPGSGEGSPPEVVVHQDAIAAEENGPPVPEDCEEAEAEEEVLVGREGKAVEQPET